MKNKNIKKRSRHLPSDKEAYQFLELIIESNARTTSPKPEELITFNRQMASLNSGVKTPPIDDPNNLYRVMDFLRRRESPRMSELAEALGISLSTATRMADALVSTGYVERLSDPTDRRLVRLVLTDNGLKAHDVIERYILKTIRKNLEFLTPEEQTVFLTLAEKITVGIKSESAKNKKDPKGI